MLEFFAKLFDTSDFPARWKCVAWSEGHGWLHILSDLGVWSAYVTIPLVLGYFILRKKVLPFRGVLALFVAFILACGTTHLMEAIIFWWPAYRLAGLIKLLTAIVSWVTVVALVPIIPKLLSMRSPEEFEREIAERQHATLALQQSVARFALAQQAASIGSFEWDIGSNRVLWTPELEALYGLPPGGFGGRYENWVAALHPMDAAEAERQVRRAIEEHEDFNTEFRIGWPDGSEHWIEALARVQHNPDGSPSRMVGIHMDVSRRKQAEAELRKTTEELLHAQEASQQRATLLQAIFDSIGEGLVVADETGKFLQWNPAAQRILGLGGKDVPPERWTEEYGLFLPDQVTPCEPQELPLARAIRGEEVDDVELFARHATLPDGAWINVTGRPLREVSGKLRGGVVIFRDVSEVKRGQETHARLASLVESSNDAIISKTLDSLITSWNAGAEKLFGYRADEVLGQSVTLLILPDHMDEEPAILDRVKKGVSIEHYETIRRRKDGVLIDVSLTVSPIKDAGGRIVGASQIARDVTERKQAEVALRESEERFRLAVIDAPFPVLLHAEDGEILQISESWTEISGYASEELRTIADWTQRAYGERKELVKSDIDRLYGLEGRRHEGEYTITTRGGEQRTWDFSSAPLGALPDGRRLVISMAMDVTERKSAEEQLRLLNAELEQRVQLRTAELEAFSYSVSHDLRAPLRAIDGFSKILLSEYAPALPEDAKTYLNDVRRNTQKMGRLIDDLLTFSRTGKQAINKQTIHTERLIRSCLEDLREEQKDRHIEIVIGDIPPCDADPALLKQVWINLLANALKYSRKRDPARIEIGCQTNSNGTGAPVFFIRDNGVGFDMQYAGRLFGVFQRLHRPADYEGTGVGLAIVKRIVSRHGGRLWAEAAPDKGATFCFTLDGGEGLLESP